MYSLVPVMVGLKGADAVLLVIVNGQKGQLRTWPKSRVSSQVRLD